MKVGSKVVLNVMATISLGLSWPLPAFSMKVGDVLPKIGVTDAAGKSSEPWSGKSSLINFWATWCDACKVELREMEHELSKVAADRKVIFVSLDKDGAKAKDYMLKEFKATPGMAERLYFDDSFKLADALGVDSFPMTIIVDQTGKITQIQSGFKEGSGSTKALFETLGKN